jgi:hypothetical protein
MPRFVISRAVLIAALGLPCGGCIESQSTTNPAPFEEQELDAALAIVCDMSGSFNSTWDDKAYPLFLDISDRFFQGAMGTKSRLVISQLSGGDQVLLFEGTPNDLRRQFRNPQELGQFLKEKADPSSSRVYESTHRTLDYVGTLPGVGPDTRLLTVILSDMLDSGPDSSSSQAAEQQLKDSLHRYQARGGAVALYYVAESERGRWTDYLQEAGFSTGRFRIESDLTSSPVLPDFE